MPINLNGNELNSLGTKLLNDTSIVNNGLTLYLDAGIATSYGGSGTTWTDLTTSANNGTLNNGPVFSTTSGGYFSFDGTNDDVSISSILNAYPFTVSFWASYPYSGWAPPTDGMDQLMNMSIAGQRISIGTVKNPGWPTGPVLMYGGSNHWSFDGSSALSTANQFYNVVWAVVANNDSNHKIYVNGVSQALTNNGGAHGGTAGWKIASNGQSSEYWIGTIANVIVYNRVLTATEVLQNYQSQRQRFGV
jgi:hypothetical protein